MGPEKEKKVASAIKNLCMHKRLHKNSLSSSNVGFSH